MCLSVAKLDADELMQSLKKLASPETFNAALEKPLTDACLSVVADAKRNCPVEDGTLRNSITYSVEEEADGNLAGYVGSNLDYAPYVHQGTGIYALEGNGRKQVPWTYYSEKDGKFHSTSGLKPTPFLQDAIDNEKDNIIQYFNQFIAELGRKL